MYVTVLDHGITKDVESFTRGFSVLHVLAVAFILLNLVEH